MKEQNPRKKIRVYIPLFAVIIVILAAAVYRYQQYAKYIKTDDAYIDTENISIGSKLMGRIIQVNFDEGDTVKKGALLAQLDSNDLRAQKIQCFALKTQAEAGLEQARAQYAYNQESLKVLEVANDKAEKDFQRAQNQFEGGVISQENFDNIKNAFETSKARLSAAKSQLKVSLAQVESARAAIKSSEAQIQVVNTQLENTKLFAPITGIVAKKWLLQGDMVQPGQSVYTLTDKSKLWVMVYLEETKISDVHVGQKSIFTTDAFPGVSFTGKVISMGSNTASQFSLIPPNNASGNFTKITQRIPLKISIDACDSDKSPSAYSILAGMSAVVKIVKE